MSVSLPLSCSNETTVLFYEEEDAQTKAAPTKRVDKPIPSIPTNMAAAQRNLKEAKVGSMATILDNFADTICFHTLC